MITVKRNLWEKFKSKKFRDAFADAHIGTNIASQIVAMREKKPWTQVELANKTGMAQARISVLEDPNYEKLTISTLKRLAKAFDVALIVRFVPFSELLDWVVNISPDKLAAAEYKSDAYHGQITDEVGRLSTPQSEGMDSCGLGRQAIRGPKIYDPKNNSNYDFEKRHAMVSAAPSSARGMGHAHQMGGHA